MKRFSLLIALWLCLLLPLAACADDGSILSEELYRIREDGTVTELVNSRTPSR